MSPVQGRVDGGRPEGGQYAATAHSDAVPVLSPTAQRMRSIAALRSQQLAWKGQQDSLDAQRYEIDLKVRQAATASAAIEMLEVLPQVATLSYRKDGSEVVLVTALDTDGTTIVDETDMCDPDSPWAKDRTFQSAVRRTEDNLQAADMPIDRWLDIDVNDAITKAAAKLESEAAG